MRLRWFDRCDSLSGGTSAETDDVAVGIFDVEIFCTPRCWRERLENRCAVRDALREVSVDAINAGGSVEVLVVATMPTFFVVLRRFFQMQLESVQMAYGVEAFPRFAKREAQLLVILDRAREIVDQKLWRKGRDAWLDCGRRHLRRTIIAHALLSSRP